MAQRGEWVTFETPERSRKYVFHDGSVLELTNVTRMKVSESGNHYLEAENEYDDRRKFIVAAGSWRSIELDIDEWTF